MDCSPASNLQQGGELAVCHGRQTQPERLDTPEFEPVNYLGDNWFERRSLFSSPESVGLCEPSFAV
jgi:hypothetical protein